jgi:hypothetical protein
MKDTPDEKMTLRLPAGLHKALQRMAAENHRSANGEILHLIAQADKAQPTCGICHQEKGRGVLVDAYGVEHPCPKCT